MKYKHVRRSGILFIFLSIITLSIWTLICLSMVNRDVNKFAKRKMCPYWIVWILSLIFLFIPTIIWMSTLSRRIEEEALELGITSPRTGFGKFFNWCFFGAFIVIGPWIAFCSTFRTLNAVLRRLNLAEPVVKPVVAPVEKPATAEEKKEQPSTPTPDVIIVRPAEPKPAPAETKPEDIKLLEQKKEPAVIFEGSATPEATKKWRVRYANSKNAVMSFATQEEAINFAKELALKNGGAVRVKGR